MEQPSPPKPVTQIFGPTNIFYNFPKKNNPSSPFEKANN